MKYKLKAQNMLEWLGLVLKKVPTPLIDISAGPIQAKCIMLAVRFGVVRSLGNGPKTAQQISSECHLNEEVLKLLLGVLVAADYVIDCKNGEFELEHHMRMLLPDHENSIENVVLLSLMEWEHFDHLEDILIKGKGIDFHSTFKNKEGWKIYQHAMLDVAKMLVDSVAKSVPVKKGATSHPITHKSSDARPARLLDDAPGPLEMNQPSPKARQTRRAGIEFHPGKKMRVMQWLQAC